MTTWNEFAWAAFLYGSLGGDSYYKTLFSDTVFMAALHAAPKELTDGDVRDHLIHFLNQWKTRVHKSSAAQLREVIVLCHPFYSILAAHRLETTGFDTTVTVSGQAMPVSYIVARCYELLDSVSGIGPTATAKTLHVLVPGLFVMWDGAILSKLAKADPAIEATGQGYVAFLKHGQAIGKDASLDFKQTILNPPPNPGVSMESYLSDRLGYSSGKTLAKYVDEYLWVTITNGAIVPPKWHP